MGRGTARPEGLSRESAERLLTWHQANRERGRGRVSLLVGEPARGRARFARWLEEGDRTLAEVHGAGEAEVARACLEHLEGGGLLREAAIERAASLLGDRPTRLAARLGALGGGELRALLDALAPRWGEEPVMLGPLAEATLARGAGAREPQMPPAGGTLLEAAAALVSSRRLPGIWLQAPAARLAEAARTLASLAARAPPLPMAMAMTEGAFREVLEAPPDRRWKALLREGRIALEDEDDNADAGAEGPPSQAPDLGALQRRAAELAARAARGEVSPDEARSAAERLLFARLEAEAETAGLFELNGRLGVPFGPAPAEVDLLCRRHAVAVEVDGYHHFVEAESFRRDRRKDVLLQKEGLLVVRCLADDVLDRIEEVVETIRDAVRSRRAGLRRT